MIVTAGVGQQGKDAQSQEQIGVLRLASLPQNVGMDGHVGALTAVSLIPMAGKSMRLVDRHAGSARAARAMEARGREMTEARAEAKEENQTPDHALVGADAGPGLVSKSDAFTEEAAPDQVPQTRMEASGLILLSGDACVVEGVGVHKASGELIRGPALHALLQGSCHVRILCRLHHVALYPSHLSIDLGPQSNAKHI